MSTSLPLELPAEYSGSWGFRVRDCTGTISPKPFGHDGEGVYFLTRRDSQPIGLLLGTGEWNRIGSFYVTRNAGDEIRGLGLGFRAFLHATGN